MASTTATNGGMQVIIPTKPSQNVEGLGNANPHSFYDCVGCGREGKEFRDSKLRILPCFHIICSLECLMKMGILECPKCNLQFKPDDISEGNVRIGELLQIYDNTLNCGCCIRGNRATNVCIQCKEYLCKDCVELHPFLRIYFDHVILPLEDSPLPLPTPQELREQNEKYCQLHSEQEVKTFCDSCCQDLCQRCAALHAGHELKTIPSVDRETEELLETVLSDSKSKCERGKQVEKNLENKYKAVQTTERAMLNELARQLELIRSAINAREEEMRKQISEIIASKCEELKVKAVSVGAENSRTLRFGKFLKTLKYHDSNQIKRRSRRLIKAGLVEINNHAPNKMEMNGNFEMDKSVCNTLIKEIKTLGRIAHFHDSKDRHQMVVNNLNCIRLESAPKAYDVSHMATQTTTTVQEISAAQNENNHRYETIDPPQKKLKFSKLDFVSAELQHQGRHLQQPVETTSENCQEVQNKDGNIEEPIMPTQFPSDNRRRLEQRKWGSKPKKFSCNTCGSKFTTKTSMTLHHKTIHLGLKTYVCNECSLPFSTPTQLRRHVRSFHLKIGQKSPSNPRPPVHLEFGYKSPSNPRQPTQRKLGLKPNNWTCNTCGSKFTTKTSMTLHHKTIHLGLKPYVCKDCLTPYSTRMQLRRHVNSVHLKISHECQLCGKLFAEKGILNKHLQNHAE